MFNVPMWIWGFLVCCTTVTYAAVVTSSHRRRHADGTYTSDVSSYLQDQAAKEFVSWLKTGRGRRDWKDPAFAISQINATILTDSVPLYVLQSVLDFFLGKMLNALTRSPVGLKLLKEILKCVRYVSDVWSSVHDMIYSGFFFFIFKITLLVWTSSLLITSVNSLMLFSYYSEKKYI